MESDHGHVGACCLNCGHALIGAHCHVCGQSGHVHRTLGAIGHDVMHAVLHLDGGFARTLPLLVWRPGELTRRYIAGERKRFVSPMSLFLFSIFALFAAFSILGIAPPADFEGGGRIQTIDYARSESIDAREQLVRKRDRLPAGSAERAGVEKRIASVDDDLAMLDRVTPDLTGAGKDANGFETGWHRLDHGIEKARKNPGLMVYKLQSNSYKFSWLLIPLSLPFMWLLFFWRRDISVYDHSVFVTYSIAFMSLFFIVLTVAGVVFGIDGQTLFSIAMFGAAAHLYRQFRGAYRLGRGSALLRTGVMSGMIAIILGLFLVLLIALGLVG